MGDKLEEILDSYSEGILYKSNPLCPLDRAIIILEETTLVKIEMFHYRKKVITHNFSVICSDPFHSPPQLNRSTESPHCRSQASRLSGLHVDLHFLTTFLTTSQVKPKGVESSHLKQFIV